MGCFLEVDLDYSYKLHDLHNKYSLAGKKIEVTSEILSDYQLKLYWNLDLQLKKFIEYYNSEKKHF